MLTRLLKPLVTSFALLGVAVVLVLVLYFIFDMEFHRKESLTTSLSTFVSLQPANAYVITQLTNTETFEVLEHHWVLEDYPVGDTRVHVSLPATYHYYIRPQELSFRLEGSTLYIEAGSLELLTPVGFDTQQVTQWGEKHWFGRAVEVVMAELQKSVSDQLEQRGRQHISLAKKQAYESLAMNVHQFLLSMKQAGFYDEIVVTFANDKNEVKQHFRFDDDNFFRLGIGDSVIQIPAP